MIKKNRPCFWHFHCREEERMVDANCRKTHLSLALKKTSISPTIYYYFFLLIYIF